MRCRFPRLATWAAPLLALACSSVDARTGFEPGVDFTSFTSFAMAPLPEKGPAHLPRYTRKRAERIREEIAAAVEERGLQQLEAGADLTVHFDVDAVRKSSDQVTEMGQGGGLGVNKSETGDIFYDTGWDDSVQVQNYTEGQIFIEFVDVASGETVWWGRASAELFDSRGFDRTVRKAIRALVSDYPPEV